METVLRYFEGVMGLTILAWVLMLGALLVAVWKIAQRYALAKNKAENLPCEKHQSDIQDLGNVINDVRISLGKLQTRQEDTYQMMQLMAATSSDSRMTQHHSPISLTKIGKEISESLKCDEILDKNWKPVSSIINGLTNPYDIQMEFITRLMLDYGKYIDEESLNKIKNDAFMRGFPLTDYMRMLGVMARDRYFKEHDIEIDDVDKNNPHLR